MNEEITSSLLSPDADDAVMPEELTAPDAALIDLDLVQEKLNDALTPGFQAEFDPAEAEAAGAFLEDALSEEDAFASTHDGLEIVLPSSQ